MSQRKRKIENDPGVVLRLWNNLVLSWRLLFDGRVNLMYKIVPVLMALYIISPIDILPEALLGPFGIFDDVGMLGALTLVLQWFIGKAPQYVVDEYQSGRKRKNDAGVIEGTYEVRED